MLRLSVVPHVCGKLAILSLTFLFARNTSYARYFAPDATHGNLILRGSLITLVMRGNSDTSNRGPVAFSTLKSRLKYQNLIANPLATMCVMSPENAMSYVEIRGRATVQDDPGRVFAREQFMVGSGGIEPPAASW